MRPQPRRTTHRLTTNAEAGEEQGTTKRLDNFFKFPRTPHLINFGAATHDDCIMSPGELTAFFAQSGGDPSISITFEEKVDGANLGFSYNPATGKIQAQNRGHYVYTRSHPQFESLNQYIYMHRGELEGVLEGGNRVLYGEWMYARHSIEYTNLPAYFIAFDILEVTAAGGPRFLDRRRFHEALEGTQIARIQPLVSNPGMYATREAIDRLLHGTRSAYSPAQGIEGIYVRCDQGGG